MNRASATTERVPLIRIRSYLLASIQVALSDQMVVRLREDVAQALSRSDARALIVDVSGIDVMDSFIARAIRDIGLLSQVMGVETAVCGIDPMIAMTLVEMGMELKGVSTTRDLDSALAQLDARLERERARESRDPLALGAVGPRAGAGDGDGEGEEALVARAVAEALAQAEDHG
ncbi:MAG TPA: STAS domain-containing protein [Myxococcales bacterium]|jgi:rsbT antagonist protein RsbS